MLQTVTEHSCVVTQLLCNLDALLELKEFEQFFMALPSELQAPEAPVFRACLEEPQSIYMESQQQLLGKVQPYLHHYAVQVGAARQLLGKPRTGNMGSAIWNAFIQEVERIELDREVFEKSYRAICEGGDVSVSSCHLYAF